MNKTDLVSSIASQSGLTKKDSESALNAMMSSVSTALKQGEKVVLVGFGTFEARKRQERKGRNPRTREEMVIPATTVPVFKAGKGLKENVK